MKGNVWGSAKRTLEGSVDVFSVSCVGAGSPSPSSGPERTTCGPSGVLVSPGSKTTGASGSDPCPSGSGTRSRWVSHGGGTEEWGATGDGLGS